MMKMANLIPVSPSRKTLLQVQSENDFSRFYENIDAAFAVTSKSHWEARFISIAIVIENLKMIRDGFSMLVIIYAISKFIGYSIWGYLGYRLYGQRPSMYQIMSIGSSRWLIGLAVGAFLFFLVTPSKEDVKAVYFLVYIPVRFFEWMIVGKIFYTKWPSLFKDPKFYFWVVGGIVVSFLIDMLSPEMIEEGRFCVGRCLC